MNNNYQEDIYSEIDLSIVVRYIEGGASPEEILIIERWISLSEKNRTEYSKLKRAWELASASAGLRSWNAQKRKEEFLKKIIGEQSTVSFRIRKSLRGRHNIITDIMKYAAVIIIVAGITGILILRRDTSPEKPGFTTITAARGSKTEMVLPDGSKLWMNAGSRIRYSNSYDKITRELFLEGEGYFEVARNNGKPFRVHAGELVIEATGTAFNVKAYPDENVIETTLVEGSVTISSDRNRENKISLWPNEQVNFYRTGTGNRDEGNFVIMKGIKPDLNTSWINDQLIISNETLESIVVKLGRKYDMEFHFDDNSLKELRYTGVLNNETIEQILDILKISSPLDYRIEKREIWLFHD
jgi:ferric-dicitrate binding protein FerR (iron transport regulator)